MHVPTCPSQTSLSFALNCSSTRRFQCVWTFPTTDSSSIATGLWADLGCTLSQRSMDVEIARPGKWTVYCMATQREKDNCSFTPSDSSELLLTFKWLNQLFFQKVLNHSKEFLNALCTNKGPQSKESVTKHPLWQENPGEDPDTREQSFDLTGCEEEIQRKERETDTQTEVDEESCRWTTVLSN